MHDDENAPPIDAEERRRRLRLFAKMGQRHHPPVFIGRAAPITDISEAAQFVYEGWKAEAVGAEDHGMTRLVQGAPGAGKTALLRHLQRDLWRTGRPGPDKPLALRLNANDLCNPEAIRERITDQLPAPLWAWSGGAVLRLVSAALPAGKEAVAPLAEKVNQAAEDYAAETTPAPIVFMIDEAQQIGPHTPEAHALQYLHQGVIGRAPVLTVVSGLAHLREHLAQDGIGISRFSDVRRCIHTLDALPPAESDDLLLRWLGHHGVASHPKELKSWQATFQRDVQGWPMHAHSFLSALADRLLAAIPEDDRLSSANMDAVRRDAAKQRLAHYDTRYDARHLKRQREKDALAKVMRQFHRARTQTEEAAYDLVEEAFGCANDKDVHDTMGTLQKQGFLQRLPARPGEPAPYGCPIPSLVSYVGMRGHAMHTRAACGDLDGVIEAIAEDPDQVLAKDALDRSALHLAAEGRWADVAEALLEAGADPDAKDGIGSTPRRAWPKGPWQIDDARPNRKPPA